MRVLRSLPQKPPPATPQPPIACATTNLDLSILKSSPPEAVELSRSNKRFTESLRECPAVVSPVRRYAERMTRLCESQNAIIAILSKEVAEQAELLRKRKKATKGKRIQLEGVYVYITEEVLRIARDAEARRVRKKRIGRQRKAILTEVDTEEEDKVSVYSLDNSVFAPSPRGRRAVFSHVEV